VIKGCNFFWVKNWQTFAALWVGALSCNKKYLESRTQLTEPIECASQGDPLLLYSAFTVFPSDTNSLCTTP